MHLFSPWIKASCFKMAKAYLEKTEMKNSKAHSFNTGKLAS